jgi:hypothetical protein
MSGTEFDKLRAKYGAGLNSPFEQGADFDPEEETPAELAANKAALLAQTNENIDSEAVSAGLEDVTLVAHMHAARARLKEVESARSRLKLPVELAVVSCTITGKIADMLRATEEPLIEQDTVGEEVHILGRRIGELLQSGGSEPHFPEMVLASSANDQVLAKHLKHASDLLLARSDQLKALNKLFKANRLELSKIRMLVNQNADDYSEVFKHQAEIIDEQKSLLSDVDRIVNSDINARV